jgi:hypothetical protein
MVLPDRDFVLATVQQCILIENDASILAHLAMYLDAQTEEVQTHAEDGIARCIHTALADLHACEMHDDDVNPPFFE